MTMPPLEEMQRATARHEACERARRQMHELCKTTGLKRQNHGEDLDQLYAFIEIEQHRLRECRKTISTAEDKLEKLRAIVDEIRAGAQRWDEHRYTACMSDEDAE